jgi:hypothetical protein
MSLKKSSLLISLSLFLAGHLFASANEMSFLLIPQNVANPGYAAHSSPLAGFVYNPAIVPKNGFGGIAGISPLYADLMLITVGGQYVTADNDCWGMNISFLRSEPVPLYTIDEYFDPHLKGEANLGWGSLCLQYAPFFSFHGWRIGFSGKLVYEKVPLLERAAVLFQVGAIKRIRTGLSFGASFNDFGIPFYFPAGLLPIHADASLHQTILFIGKNKMDIYLGARYILTDNIRALAGLECSRVFPYFGFSVKSDYQYGAGAASSLQDGFSVGGSIWMMQWTKLEFQYLLKFSSAGWTHQLGVAYGLVGRP